MATAAEGAAERTARFPEGTPCWADAMLPDLEAGKRFYGELFGWTFGTAETAELGLSVEARRDGRRAAALAQKRDGRLPTVWTVYVATPDAMATMARIRAAGGQPVREPLVIDDRAVVATAADPGGAVFGLWQPGTHGGFETRGRPGSFVWAEVHTREKAAVDAFYAEVFGYGMRDLSGGDDGLDFMVWSLGGESAGEVHAVGGRAMIDPSLPVEMPAHFLTYFAVEDCDAAARNSVRLGGRTRSAPRTTPFGRRAVLDDSQGATFAVIDVATAALAP